MTSAGKGGGGRGMCEKCDSRVRGRPHLDDKG